ncbi:hypothetical protein F4814DRAFT_414546 [Daldinia grandis]|nr:hypothetical protein F4814DRAFT_414546 [Daldinia grandis]
MEHQEKLWSPSRLLLVVHLCMHQVITVTAKRAPWLRPPCLFQRWIALGGARAWGWAWEGLVLGRTASSEQRTDGTNRCEKHKPSFSLKLKD